MNELERTAEFDLWLRSLRDRAAKMRILERLKRASRGAFGDVSAVGGGLREMRIHSGPGYRVYFIRRGEITYLLDKSTQQADIRRARELVRSLED